MSSEDEPETPAVEKTASEAQSIAQLAAGLAAPMEAETEPDVSPQTETSAEATNTAAESVSTEAPEISPERLAMRQLQGRLRKNLLLKRPSKLSSAAEDEESESEESPAAMVEASGATGSESQGIREETESDFDVPNAWNSEAHFETGIAAEPEIETVISPSVELVTQPDTDALASPEVGLVTQADRDEKPEAPELPEPEAPQVPPREVIRIEKSSESFTHLHTAIEYAVGNPNFHTDGLTDSSLFQSNRPVVMGVTSAISGEGKTTVALHLAMDIARNNFKKVCLIDMSLGEDTLSRRLEINSINGLVNVLEGTNDTLPTIETVKYEGLSIMPAGKTPENAARAARSPLVMEVLVAARKLFDVIIVDMPAMSSGNVLPIAPHLDAVVMVVYAGVTPKEVVAGALERLDQNKVLGVVLNRVTTAMPTWLQKRLNRW